MYAAQSIAIDDNTTFTILKLRNSIIYIHIYARRTCESIIFILNQLSKTSGRTQINKSDW